MCACVVSVQHADTRRPTRDDILASFDSKFHASVSEAFPTSFQSMPAQSNMQQFQSMPPQSNMQQRSSSISNQAPYDTRVSDHRLTMKCFCLTHNNPSNPPSLSLRRERNYLRELYLRELRTTGTRAQHLTKFHKSRLHRQTSAYPVVDS